MVVLWINVWVVCYQKFMKMTKMDIFKVNIFTNVKNVEQYIVKNAIKIKCKWIVVGIVMEY